MRKDTGSNFVYNEYFDSGIKNENKALSQINIDCHNSSYRDLGETIENLEIKGEVLSSFENSTWGVGKVGNSEECNLACAYGNN